MLDPRPAVVLLLLALCGCVPATAAYLSIPVEAEDGMRHERTRVRVALADLRARMPGFDARRVAFYCRGRAPMPHRLVDEDGDGEADAAEVVIPVDEDGVALIAVCPGPRANEGPGAGGAGDGDGNGNGVVLRFDRARQ